MISPTTISEAVYALFIATQRADKEAKDVFGDILETMLDRKLSVGEKERSWNEFLALFVTET
jgi:hypothetical protein